MGTIADFDINALIDKYSLSAFVETGTGTGDSLRHAMGFPFLEIHSCESHKRTFDALSGAVPRDPRLHLENLTSELFLKKILGTVGRALIFLDAHFTGSYAGIPIDPSEKTPLGDELQIIAAIRRPSGDVIIIDDLRIYENGPFQNGEYPHKQTDLNGWLFPFLTSHDMSRDYRREGYVVMLPKRDGPAGF